MSKILQQQYEDALRENEALLADNALLKNIISEAIRLITSPTNQRHIIERLTKEGIKNWNNQLLAENKELKDTLSHQINALAKCQVRRERLREADKDHLSATRGLKQRLQDKSTDFSLTLEDIGKALGIQTGREKWWDGSSKTKIEMIMLKIIALQEKP